MIQTCTPVSGSSFKNNMKANFKFQLQPISSQISLQTNRKPKIFGRQLQQSRRIFCQQPDFSEKPDYVSPEQVQISDKLMQEMTNKIKSALETEDVKVVDAYGDSRHVSIDVVSELFDGKTAVQRQRMVYKAIWQELQDTVHAVDAMKTQTPQEATGKN
eukprot:TRINITY_DN1617_c0_g2_i1.p1 TRINITY_DN1617_c0_g2~~TRINITY_DN1617_c0_g2_i1.p1  ORF type:complete len:159 (+),score=24.17 TRINITY_DN1617_c0_g2_i1:39-515(+)